MRTNLILLFALLLFLVGFFSSQMSLTGNYSREAGFTSLSEQELADFGSLTLDDCRNIARISAYNDKSKRLAKVEDTSTYPLIISTLQYSSNYYSSFDINNDGKTDTRDTQLCYAVVREIGAYGRSSANRQRPLTAINECSPEGRRTCSNNILMECTHDAYGILSWAKISEPNAGQRCRGSRLVTYVVGKQPLNIPFLFSAPSP